ncbi:uncharacterized protein TrAFT101_001915 [Trichoderma asperellum]|uniref:Uncharacterized protein n=1 Tax=Trichoderma asperellum (strain ATCC 204424 / CBS 433.97 / NBRC 101777) TaxID=1042311 RepID=A0A2T3ZEZ2_TRIA4|nr:hypothetical protein M441DRAFT_67115 [Trichoderma asperellum CBS 433.97]PTB43360.1 hypothetical protein M441DRAFT_67115 [Trichoderma asperellum CBS 433.97]UKZ86075.1 hypothetical protein TrAFT101_001915 [Trichoderma asperellum]
MKNRKKKSKEQSKALPLLRESAWTIKVPFSARLAFSSILHIPCCMLRWLALLFLAKYDSTASVSSGELPAEARLASWIVTFFLSFRLTCRKYAIERDAEPE